MGPFLSGRRSPWVFPGTSGDGHYAGSQRLWEKVRARADLDGVRLHDFRHSFASIGVAGGDSLYVIGHLLGHTRATTTQRYAHIADDPLKAAAERISGVIDAAMRGGVGAEIVELEQKR